VSPADAADATTSRAPADATSGTPAAREAPADAPPPLQPLAEDWQRALVVVAHPDDMEYGGASAVARWTDAGRTVVYRLATSGEAGIDGIPPERCGPLREQEQRAACAAVGVDDLAFLGFPDGTLEYGLPLRRAVAREVRRTRPDVVLTGNYRPTWGGTAPNQADHIAVGRAVVDGVRDAGNRWVFRDLLDDEGLEPWGGVRQVWAVASPDAGHAVDVTATFSRGLDSLRAHRAYLEGLGADPEDVTGMLTGFARSTGRRLGVELAVAFEVVDV
jgi:LmbE family N-acetylglucosaminyl deacetylase